MLARWRSFNLDEYVGLGADHPAFLRGLHATAAGADPLAWRPSCLQLPDGAGCQSRIRKRALRLGPAAAGGIDLQLLGLGGNGHVGFNEPPCGPEPPAAALS